MVNEEDVLRAHEIKNGKIEISPKVKFDSNQDLAIYYTPGVASVCNKIKDDRDLAYKYTNKGNTIAVVSDGTRILGLGNIGPEAGLPVMEGKALLFKVFGNVDAIPICIGTTDEAEIVKFVKAIAPSVGGINIEDIESPKSFRVTDTLSNELNIPVLHDDQQGTAVVILAGIINSLKLVNKSLDKVKIVVNGAGSAGLGVVRILNEAGAKNVYVLDSKGIISKNSDLRNNEFKKEIADKTNKDGLSGDLKEAASGADILIGLSKPGLFTKEIIDKMNDKPIIFALANPTPEVDYEEGKEFGAYIMGTGRSDKPNQVNNLLGFPGIMRGLLDARATKVTYSMLVKAAYALADSVGDKLSVDYILPRINDPKDTVDVFKKVAFAVAEASVEEGNSVNKSLDLIKDRINKNLTKVKEEN